MQKVVYTCDQCEEIIGPKKHFSMQFAQHSGVAQPPRTKGNINSDSWNIMNKGKLYGKFIHLCGIKCVTAYFKQLLKQTE